MNDRLLAPAETQKASQQTSTLMALIGMRALANEALGGVAEADRTRILAATDKPLTAAAKDKDPIAAGLAVFKTMARPQGTPLTEDAISFYQLNTIQIRRCARRSLARSCVCAVTPRPTSRSCKCARRWT